MLLIIKSGVGKKNIFRLSVILCSAIFTLAAKAQSVPTDMLDIAIEDLLLIDVMQTERSSDRPWSISYTYYNHRFSGYLDGSDRVSTEDVLFRPGEESRTNKNYPVVPTDIEQDLHSVAVTYELNPQMALSAAVSYISQSTDHISIVPGYDAFVISSEGIGDITIAGHYRLRKTITGQWSLGLGLSIPTGSTDEKGDTPRAPGDQILPYTMQIGSGTHDIPVYVSYRGHDYSFDWGVALSAKVRSGENDRGYRLGNTLTATSWLTLQSLPYIQPSIGLSYRNVGGVIGKDKSLAVPGPYPYPAPVVDPDAFGGETLSVNAGMKIPIYATNHHISLEFSKPILQSLNGPQTSTDYQFSISLNLQL